MEPDDQATPQQIVDAWTAMGPSGDRARVMQAITGIEEIVREMGRDLEYLQHPDQWDNPGGEYGEPVQFIHHHLATSNESAVILARLADLRALLDRVLPRPGG
jgi:hypothetical protein